MRYKNVSAQDLDVMGVGFVKAGDFIETNEPVYNPNLQLVETATQKPIVEPKKEE